MTIVGPLLIALVYGVSIWLAMNEETTDSEKNIVVFDESKFFNGKLEDAKKIHFHFSEKSTVDIEKQKLKESDDYGILYIPSTFSPDNPKGIYLYSLSQPGILIQDFIEKQIKQIVEDVKFEREGINRATLEKIKTKINIKTIKLTEKGEERGSAGAALAIGMISALMIYIFIFLYGVQVMRGVLEEKTSRIIEVLVSSVKPFQLMMGKIVGIAAVGLTQFLLWVILSAAVTSAISGFYGNKFKEKIPLNEIQKNEGIENVEINEESVSGFLSAFSTVNYPLVLGSFLFYFLGGYLLYSALFAAIGSAVDAESETQQFMLPVTIPLILAMVMIQFILKNPDGPVAFWFSIIPLTSPVIMMMRIPFGVPVFDLVLSMCLLVLGFLGSVWLASRVFRVGILMWGKKVTPRELFKWFFYR